MQIASRAYVPHPRDLSRTGLALQSSWDASPRPQLERRLADHILWPLDSIASLSDDRSRIRTGVSRLRLEIPGQKSIERDAKKSDRRYHTTVGKTSCSPGDPTKDRREDSPADDRHHEERPGQLCVWAQFLSSPEQI